MKTEEIKEITPSEAIVLREAMYGLSNKKIAKKLYISPHTVKFHLQSLYYKTQTHTRTELCNKIICIILGDVITPELILQKFGKNRSIGY